jgi:lysophospholipid acyltransferase (LPLAT)-like uncharacterized protein
LSSIEGMELRCETLGDSTAPLRFQYYSDRARNHTMNDAADPRTARTQRAEARADVTENRDRRGRNVWWRRGFRIARRSVGGWLTWLLLPGALRLLAATWRVQRIDFDHFESAEAAGGFLIAIWHGDMLAPLPLHTKRGSGVLVSPSRDGGLVKMVLLRYGYTVIRGSTNRGSARALREIREHLAGRGSVAITPDGPRGPRHSMNLGLAWLAREARCPIVCVRVRCDRAWSLKSWDRFQIPRPFARVIVEYEEPLTVASDADDAELERMTEVIRRGLEPAGP